MRKLQAIIEHADQHCKKNGARLTAKRKQILSGLLQSDKALSAYELIDYFKKQHGETIPAMSVYRILDFLEGQQLVHRLNLANKYVACSHITGQHEHAASQFVICRQCQRVKEIDINDSVVQSLQQDVRDAGFEMDGQQLEINGLCENCVKSSA